MPKKFRHDIFALRAKYLYVLVNVLRYTMPRIVISDMYLKELDIRKKIRHV
jgi:hypothetical protein